MHTISKYIICTTHKEIERFGRGDTTGHLYRCLVLRKERTKEQRNDLQTKIEGNQDNRHHPSSRDERKIQSINASTQLDATRIISRVSLFLSVINNKLLFEIYKKRIPFPNTHTFCGEGRSLRVRVLLNQTTESSSHFFVVFKEWRKPTVT